MGMLPSGMIETLTRERYMAIRDADAERLRRQWKKREKSEREDNEFEVRGAAVGDDPVPRR